MGGDGVRMVVGERGGGAEEVEEVEEEEVVVMGFFSFAFCQNKLMD